MKGYSLIELVMVIVILAILSISVFVYINSGRSITINSASDKIISDIRYAQGLSMSTTNWHGISFEVNPLNRYSVYTTTGTQDAIIDDPLQRGRSYIVNLSGDYNAAISSVSISGGKKIEFNPLGQPFSDKLGSAITSEGTIVISGGAYSRTIYITPNTGRVRAQ